MSTAAAKRRTTATERKESQGGPGRRWGGGPSPSEGQQWPLARGLSLGVVSTDRWNHGTEALCAETELNECRSWRELRAAGWGVEGVWAQGGAERTGLQSSGSRSDPRRPHLGC